MKHFRTPINRGQSVIEMALILPLLLALVFNFIALMMVIVFQQEFTSAVTAAADSAITAPFGNYSQAMNIANCSFDGQAPGCPFPGTFQPPNFVHMNQGLSCSGDYLSGTPNYTNSNGVTCSASATIDFQLTPLGMAVFWTVPLQASVTVYPSPLRERS